MQAVSSLLLLGGLLFGIPILAKSVIARLNEKYGADSWYAVTLAILILWLIHWMLNQS